MGTQLSYLGTAGLEKNLVVGTRQGVTSNAAAYQIKASCEKKFQPDAAIKAKIGKLPIDKVLNITGRASLGNAGYFSGTLYNGNKNTTVTEISVLITISVNGKEVKRTYTDEVKIEPQKTSMFSFTILQGDKDTDFSWRLIDAKGF